MIQSLNTFFRTNTLATAVILFVLNLALKLSTSGVQDISLDEPFTIYHAQFAVPDIIKMLKGYNNPPLFEILLHFWIKIFGISPFSVRFLPCLFGALGAFALFMFAKKHFNFSIAILSSLLFTFSTLGQFYAHDSRVYTLFLLLALLSMDFFLKFISQDRKKWAAILFVLTNVLLIYAHYFGIFILLIQIIILIVFKRNFLTKFTGLYFLTAVFYLPQVLTLISRYSESTSKGTEKLIHPDGVEDLYNMLWSFSNQPVTTVICIVILIGALAKFLITRKNSGFNHFTSILIWFLIPFFGMFLISFKVPMYQSRYLIFILPAYYILLSVSIHYLFSGKRHWIPTLLLILVFGITFEINPSKKRDIKGAMARIKTLKTEGAFVFTAPVDFLPAFGYHYNQSYFTDISDGKEYVRLADRLSKENIFVGEQIELSSPLTAQNNIQKIIYLDVGSFTHQKNLDYLNARYELQRKEHFPEVLDLYVFIKK